jgi:hypothetical protein
MKTRLTSIEVNECEETVCVFEAQNKTIYVDKIQDGFYGVSIDEFPEFKFNNFKDAEDYALKLKSKLL